MNTLELRFSDGTTKAHEFDSLEEMGIFLTFVINGFVKEDGTTFKGFKQFFDEAAAAVVVEMKTELEIDEHIAEERRQQMGAVHPDFANRIMPPFQRNGGTH